ncbi:MAG: glutamyl-tRNA reductase [Schwartzia sp.]|nr:glutamyl-tRNA reductase [Schwartzia sp. (in: firmicutes)]
MQLVVLGLNHKTAPVEVRERFSLTKEQIRSGLRHLGEYGGINEAVVLSTCNRNEFYAVVDSDSDESELLKTFWSDLTGNEEDISEYLYIFKDEKCIRHLFNVASSLDSLVIGEGQILSQVKQAYTLANEEGATSTILNTLFHRAITTGKRVRTETRIAFNAVSVSYAAVELARQIFGELNQSAALIFGAGKMAELTAENLVGRGVKKIYVANRHKDKAEEMAAQFNGEAVEFDEALLHNPDVDVVVTSTGAPHYVVTPWETQLAMKKRHGRPLVFIDIAVPRDVDPEVDTIPGVTVYNIDDLEEVVDEHRQEREKEAHEARGIVDEEVKSILDKFQYLSFQPLMARLSKRADMVRSRELRRALGKLPDLSESDRRIVEQMSRMIVRKLLRFPMMEINASAGTDREQFYIEAMRSLFKLDVIGEAESSETENRNWNAQQ